MGEKTNSKAPKLPLFFDNLLEVSEKQGDVNVAEKSSVANLRANSSWLLVLCGFVLRFKIFLFMP